ncbi:MAG: serine hydrolase domain-containing protein [Kineosporiaceae bacterium]
MVATGAADRVELRGRTDARWQPLADELAAVAARDDVVGAALCVYEGDRCVVDVAAGWTDLERTRPRRLDDRHVIFSAVKGVVSGLVACLAADGTLDLSAPVTDLWPEFAAHGKDRLTVADLLAHRAGVPAVDRPLTLAEILDVESLADALAAQRPLWPPGRAHGYHAFTWGALASRLVTRATGRPLLDELHTRVIAPLGVPFSIGEPPEGDGGGEVVPLVAAPPAPAATAAAFAAARATRALGWRAMTMDGTFDDPDGYGVVAEWPEVRRSVLPASGGVSDARSLARIYAALVCPVEGVRLADHRAMSAATRVRSSGIDLCLVRLSAFGAGFARRSATFPLPFATSFGHTGVGGVVAFGDPRTGISAAYVPSRVTVDVATDPSWRRLARVLRRVATGRRPRR